MIERLAYWWAHPREFVAVHIWHIALIDYFMVAAALYWFVPSLRVTMRIEEAALTFVAYIGLIQAARHGKFAYDADRYETEWAKHRGEAYNATDEAASIVARDRLFNRAFALASQFMYFLLGVLTCFSGMNTTPLTPVAFVFSWGLIALSMISNWNGRRSETARNRLRAILPKTNGNGNGKH